MRLARARKPSAKQLGLRRRCRLAVLLSRPPQRACASARATTRRPCAAISLSFHRAFTDTPPSLPRFHSPSRSTPRFHRDSTRLRRFYCISPESKIHQNTDFAKGVPHGFWTFPQIWVHSRSPIILSQTVPSLSVLPHGFHNSSSTPGVCAVVDDAADGGAHWRA